MNNGSGCNAHPKNCFKVMGCLVVIVAAVLLFCGPIGWAGAAVLLIWYSGRSTAKSFGKEFDKKNKRRY